MKNLLVFFLFYNMFFSLLLSQKYCTKTGLERITGIKDGYRYELWNQYGQGVACMTVDSGALFSGVWNGIHNYLARRGLEFDTTRIPEEIGTFVAKYNCNYNPESKSGLSYLAVYGWTINPLVEYYIVEDWRNWIPSMAPGSKFKGTIKVDGSIYDIYENIRIKQPSILGDTTFVQYFSIRRDTRNSGIISITEHFKKWQSLNMPMGYLFEVSFVVEGYESNGSFKFNQLEIYITKK